jgi:sugar transferase (PEP-CTERM system associated)
LLRLFRQYYPIRNVIFATGEGLFIYLSVIIAAWIKIGSDIALFDKWIILKSLLITITCQLSLYYHDLYDFKIVYNIQELGIRLLQALGIVTILFGMAYFFAPGLMIGEGIFVIIVGVMICLIVSWRIGYNYILDHNLFTEKIFIIGSGELAKAIHSEIENKPDSGYKVTSVMQEQECSQGVPESDLCDTALKSRIKKIIVAMEEKRGNFPIAQLLRCRTEGIEIIEGTSFYEMLMGKLYVRQINPAWLIFSDGFRKSRFKSFAKRSGDLVLSTLMLILLAPLMLITAVLIKVESRGPIIFSQERAGQYGKPFKIKKFRSMVTDAEKSTGPVWAGEHDDRITKVGQVIRKLRIDELPQLWNVFRGEMSFVGPRPERQHFIRQLEKEIPYYSERLTVKPGITGWAQVCYPYGASVEDAVEKLNYDLFYIKNLTFFLDLLVIFRTVKIVLFGKGAR